MLMMCCTDRSAFLKKAADFGADIKDGFDMLFYQAIRALEVWLGRDLCIDLSALENIYDRIKSQSEGTQR